VWFSEEGWNLSEVHWNTTNAVNTGLLRVFLHFGHHSQTVELISADGRSKTAAILFFDALQTLPKPAMSDFLMEKSKPTKKRIVLSVRKSKPLRLVADDEYMQSKFVGSNAKTRNGKKRSAFKFHRPTCDWAKKIKLGNLIEFDSHEEAVAAGFKPCGTCRA